MTAAVAGLIGLVVALLMTMTGMGGGVLLLPLLLIVLHVPPLVAIGTGAAYAALTKSVAALTHVHRGTVDWNLAGAMACGSIPAALGGVWLLSVMHAHLGNRFDTILTVFIGIVLLVIGVSALLRSPTPHRDGLPLRRALPKYINRYNGAVIAGIVGGLLVGLTSIGSGSVIMMLLLLFYRKSPAELVGTDVFHGFLLMTVTALAHLRLGTIDSRLVGFLLIGALPGVLIGSRLVSVLPGVWLKRIVLILTICTGVALARG